MFNTIHIHCDCDETHSNHSWWKQVQLDVNHYMVPQVQLVVVSLVQLQWLSSVELGTARSIELAESVELVRPYELNY